jgi:uncharacterized protein DUF6647
MDVLMTAIVVWLSANSFISANFNHPHIEYASQARMIEMRLHGTHSAAQSTNVAGQIPDVVAVYDDDAHTIYLPNGWTGTTPAELSVLVHEMVHHLQNVNGQKFECPAAREKPAYLAQDQWLKQFGHNLENDFSVDMFTVVVKSACMF